MMVLDLFRTIDQLWLDDGCDMCSTHFNVVCTQHNSGTESQVQAYCTVFARTPSSAFEFKCFAKTNLLASCRVLFDSNTRLDSHWLQVWSSWWTTARLCCTFSRSAAASRPTSPPSRSARGSADTTRAITPTAAYVCWSLYRLSHRSSRYEGQYSCTVYSAMAYSQNTVQCSAVQCMVSASASAAPALILFSSHVL